MDAKKFFTDSLDRLPPPPADLEERNLLSGLLALAKQLDRMEARQKKMETELHQAAAQIRQR